LPRIIDFVGMKWKITENKLLQTGREGRERKKERERIGNMARKKDNYDEIAGYAVVTDS